MVIRKGSAIGSFPRQRIRVLGMRLGLVIQSDVLNDSKISTVIMVAITSTLKFGELPGNVVLNKGEANLPRKCVVNVTQIKSVGKSASREIGTLPKSGCKR